MFVILNEMAHPERFERPTPRFVVWCSIQLSYGCLPKGRRTHTVSPKGMQACFPRLLQQYRMNLFFGVA